MSDEMDNKDGPKSGLGVHPNAIPNEAQDISTGGIPADPVMMDQLLLDPDEVCRQLESVNLTEEDTDILLQDALQLNKMLKAHLSKQQQEESLSKKSKRKSTPDGKKSKKASSPGGGDLPPLDTKRGLSAAQMRIRQPPQSQQRGASASKKMSSRSPLSTETSKPARSKTASSSSSRSRSKSTESSKKEWSDRW